MTDARQWVQPLFMVYDVGTDELVPLTQERLDALTATEQQYGMLIRDIRNGHEAFANKRGWKAASFVGFEK